jgi:DNA invertase Pin-like site-specific DNA recombinase
MSQQTKRAAIYARVATASNISELDDQIEECTKYCNDKGYLIEERHIFLDVGSGNHYKDPEDLTALGEASNRGEFDVLVVYAFDHLLRMQSLVAALREDLESLGVQVESVTELKYLAE